MGRDFEGIPLLHHHHLGWRQTAGKVHDADVSGQYRGVHHLQSCEQKYDHPAVVAKVKFGDPNCNISTYIKAKIRIYVLTI